MGPFCYSVGSCGARGTPVTSRRRLGPRLGAEDHLEVRVLPARPSTRSGDALLHDQPVRLGGSSTLNRAAREPGERRRKLRYGHPAPRRAAAAGVLIAQEAGRPSGTARSRQPSSPTPSTANGAVRRASSLILGRCGACPHQRAGLHRRGLDREAGRPHERAHLLLRGGERRGASSPRPAPRAAAACPAAALRHTARGRSRGSCPGHHQPCGPCRSRSSAWRARRSTWASSPPVTAGSARCAAPGRTSRAAVRGGAARWCPDVPA